MGHSLRFARVGHPCAARRMNNGGINEVGLLGQFSKSSYCTLGDPYVKKGTMLSRYKKKQFQTNPAKKGRSKDSLFGKAFPYLAEGDKYVDRTWYLKTQPRENRKKGFLSSDAHRADEFSSTIRTNQYRWQLGREQAVEIGKLHAALETPNFLYDIGKGKYVTPFDQKLSRESWYQANRDGSAPRNMGDWTPSSYEIGNEMVQEFDLQKPTYATTPIIRSTFYRVGNLRANSGWAALPGTAN